MFSIIVAVSRNRVIGKNGDIPWYLPDDLKRFAKITKGHTVIMGRKTYESIIEKLGKPLPDRKSVVITSQHNFDAPGCVVLQSVDEAIHIFSKRDDEIFVIGGSEIYKQFMPITEKLYVTEVNVECDGDAFFPNYDHKEWNIVFGENHSVDVKHAYAFLFIEMKKA